MKIAVINGPNLNLLGKREPEIYGTISFETYFKELVKEFPQHRLEYFQSNVEGELINKIQSVGFDHNGIIINAGGYSHTSVAIADAISSVPCPAIEVHISNIYARERFRHNSFLSSVCKGVICGFGLNSYKLALQSFENTSAK